jgi:transcriptional regulator with XRE-family HTH domain
VDRPPHPPHHSDRVAVSALPLTVLGPDPALIAGLLRESLLEARLESAHKVARRMGWTKTELAELVQSNRRVRGVTQPQLGTLIGVSIRQLQRYLSGSSKIPADIVPRISAVLGMNPARRRQFYILALGREPDPVAAAPDASRIPATWMDFLHEQKRHDPAFVCDATNTVIMANDAFWECFPWASPDGPTPEYNVSRIVLSEPARGCLRNWEDDWALPAIQHIWYSHLKHPDNPTLRELIVECSHDAGLEKLWRQRTACPPESWDGATRRLRHPVLGERAVRLRTHVPESLRAVGYRCIVLLLTDPEAEEG